MSSVPKCQKICVLDKHSVTLWIGLTLLVAAFTVTYFDAMKSIVAVWLHRPAYSHGFLILFISAYIIYFDRNRLAKIPVKPNVKAGLPLTVIACILLLVGSASSTEAFLHLSVLIVIPGLLMMHLGAGWVKKLVFPLAYLVFMVPIADVFLSGLHWPAQLFSAKMATQILHYLQIPVVVEDQIIHFPATSLEVAKACSGVRFLVAMLALGIPLAHFTQRNIFWKGFLVLLGVMIVIPVNVVRVVLIGVWAYRGGDVLHGPFHVLQGLFVAVVGFALLFVLAHVLSRVLCTQNAEMVGDTGVSCEETSADTEVLRRPWIIAVVLLSLTGCQLLLYEPEPVKLAPELSVLPHVVGRWTSEAKEYEYGLINVDHADAKIFRSYRDVSGRRINVYVGYFESQSRNKELVNYEMGRLLQDVEEIDIRILDQGFVTINKGLVDNGGDSFIVLYWYDLNGKVLSKGAVVKIMTGISGVVRRKTNGAIVIVSCSLSDSSGIDHVVDSVIEFVRMLLPALPDFTS